MRGPIVLTAIIVMASLTAACGSSISVPDNFVFVRGGSFKDTRSNYYARAVAISDFYMDKYAVTQKEWTEVMGSNPSTFRGDDLPVEMVTWYDAIEYCNRRSIKEGLQPYYNIDKSVKDPDNIADPEFGDLDGIKWTVSLNEGANGYRLPTEAEWEYAAGGGQRSKSYTYSGSDFVEEVAWYWRNSGDKPLEGAWNWPLVNQNHDQTKAVGHKKANELGLYDMSGNVRQWCWDWRADPSAVTSNVTDPRGAKGGFRRVWKGGGWMGEAFACRVSFRGALAANGKGPDQGLRVCRSRL